jgi:hypothetical protein
MYENGEMRSTEAILRRGEKGIKENDGGDEFNFCDYHNVSQYNSMTLKIKLNLKNH